MHAWDSARLIVNEAFNKWDDRRVRGGRQHHIRNAIAGCGPPRCIDSSNRVIRKLCLIDVYL